MTHPTKIFLYHHQDQNREIRRDIFRHVFISRTIPNKEPPDFIQSWLKKHLKLNFDC